METLFSKSNVTTIILAGGKSSRMGQDKALILIEDIPLLKKIANLGKKCTSQVYIISPWIERYQSIIPPGCYLVKEIIQGKGPLIGFAQALPYIDTEWVLLLSCDLPCLIEDEIEKWLISLENISQEAIALLPKNSKGWEPLCGFYRSTCLDSLRTFIKSGGQSFQGWLNQQLVEKLYISDESVLFNCNTPDDLECLRKKISD